MSDSETARLTHIQHRRRPQYSHICTQTLRQKLPTTAGLEIQVFHFLHGTM